jgi:hypothetical protein
VTSPPAQKRGVVPARDDAKKNDNNNTKLTEPRKFRNQALRINLFECPICNNSAFQEPAEGGCMRIRCHCGEFIFSRNQRLPITGSEWGFLVKRITRGLSRAPNPEQIAKLLSHDHIQEFRKRFGGKEQPGR